MRRLPVDFDEFARTEAQPLLRFARVLIGDRSTAEDIVQDVLVRLYRRSGSLGKVHDLPAYARRMVVNEYLSWGRKWFRVRPTAQLPERSTGPDEMQQVTDRDQLRVELGKLPARQRTVLVLRYFAGYTDAEIAAELGCTAGTVRSHASRALSALRVEISTDIPEHVRRTTEALS
jgi:RNA polymerase sigma-70 factor (sigma-E family)